MNESRIALLAALPMLVGAVLVAGLRKPPVMLEHEVAHGVAATDAGASEARAADPVFPGVIVSGYTADVGAELGGAVLEIWGSVGARVRAGDPLLQIDPTSAGEELRVAEARLQQQRSSVERARAELAEATDVLQRMESMQAGVSERSLVAARTKAEQARAAVREAEAGLGMQQAQLGRQRTHSKKHVIRAPFDGIIVARYADPGDVLVPGQTVVRVITEDHHVRFALQPEQAPTLMAGQRVEVRLPDGRVMAGEVTDVQPEVDAATQLVLARARLEQPQAAPAEGAEALIVGTQVEVRPQRDGAGGR